MRRIKIWQFALPKARWNTGAKISEVQCKRSQFENSLRNNKWTVFDKFLQANIAQSATYCWDADGRCYVTVNS